MAAGRGGRRDAHPRPPAPLELFVKGLSRDHIPTVDPVGLHVRAQGLPVSGDLAAHDAHGAQIGRGEQLALGVSAAAGR